MSAVAVRSRLEPLVQLAEDLRQQVEPVRLNAHIAVPGTVRCLESLLQSGFCPDVTDFPAFADHYGRYCVQRGPIQVLLVAWGPGQGTPIHTHDGAWGVEAVLEGKLDITPYDFEHAEGRIKLKAKATLFVPAGTIETTLPPHDHHVVRNNTGRVAMSLHVYSHEITRCSRFVRVSEAWCEEEVQLKYDAEPLWP